jgi:hypothetical protein
MDRVCPRCRGTTSELFCPRCGVRTAASLTTAGDSQAGQTAAAWALGLVVAQGLAYALRRIVTGCLLASGGEAAPAEFWEVRFAGLVTGQALQAVSLFVGAMIATAGRRRGPMIGATLGLADAALFAGIRLVFGHSGDELTWIGQPLLLAVVGALGGVVGSRVWRPVPELPPIPGEGPTGRDLLTTVLPERPAENMVEPIPWSRIAAGVLVAVGGTIGARFIRDFVVIAGGGKGREMMQSHFITWEITVLAQLVGGAIAGATARSAVVWGFWVGLASSVPLIAAQVAGGIGAQVVVPAWLLGATVPERSPAAFAILGVQALVMGMLGGWLGGLVLPSDPGNRPGGPR